MCVREKLTLSVLISRCIFLKGNNARKVGNISTYY